VGSNTALCVDMSLVSCAVRVEIPQSGRSLFQRSPADCVVSERDRDVSIIRRTWPNGGLLRHGEKQILGQP
jgi:hypothetical protein